MLFLSAAAWLAAMNFLLYVLMGYDKHCARSGRPRIPERTLFLLALLGGSIGGTMGMHHFHHKTRKAKFALGFPLLILFHAWVVVVVALFLLL